jgi:hypothetical protein
MDIVLPPYVLIDCVILLILLLRTIVGLVLLEFWRHQHGFLYVGVPLGMPWYGSKSHFLIFSK